VPTRKYQLQNQLRIRKMKHSINNVNLELPQAPMPVGNYQATIAANNLVFISGQLPFKNGKLIYCGQLGKELTTEEGRQAAKMCALNILSHIANLAPLIKIKKVIKLEGFINSDSTFTEHAEVLNGASDLLAEVLGDRAGHIRTVLGCNSLPMGAAVEISAIVELK